MSGDVILLALAVGAPALAVIAGILTGRLSVRDESDLNPTHLLHFRGDEEEAKR